MANSRKKIQKPIETFITRIFKIESQLNEKYSFDNFIAGDSNQSTLSAGIFVTSNLGEKLFNPLFIFGGMGLGKSHLVHAMGNEIKEQYPEKSVLYTSSEIFRQQYLDAENNNNRDKFVNWLQSIDVLILEDIQCLSGQTTVQEVILEVFNNFCQKGKQIILTADRALIDMQDINPQLLSRFKGGLTVELQQLDYVTRIDILRNLLLSTNVEITEEIIDCIARNINSNLKDLKGCLHYLISELQLNKKEITLEFTKKVIRKINSITSSGFAMDLTYDCTNTINVIGIGIAGDNSVNDMIQQKIKGVDFMVCSSDAKVIENKRITHKTQLGNSTKMAVIIAEMGGATETETASIIAHLAKERDNIKIGIVSIPFLSEGKLNYEKAHSEIKNMRKQFDSLIVIDNNKSNHLNENLNFESAFQFINDTITNIVKGIVEIVYNRRFDLKDFTTVLGNSGSALVGSSVVSGENRAKNAIVSALFSPLLKEEKITKAKNVLLLVTSGTIVTTIDEVGEINDYIQSEAGYEANIIMSVTENINLSESIAITIIATGFDTSIE
ncbi:DnaA ATPase domain-containing protein [Flavobacterium sp. CAN_S2]|uniref:DnaA ATPase domain-containing protein n=1 Tax=Flavobacterium sp. CAN_S2 TaxID=2787726 RepID=UPI0018C94DEF